MAVCGTYSLIHLGSVFVLRKRCPFNDLTFVLNNLKCLGGMIFLFPFYVILWWKMEVLSI